MKSKENKAYKLNVVRQHNIRLIMNLLYSAPLSCAELSRMIAISDVGAKKIITYLQANDLLLVAPNNGQPKSQGNQHIRYTINPDIGIFVVFDFTQYHDKVCIFDFAGKLIYSEHFEIDLMHICYNDVSNLVLKTKSVISKLNIKCKKVLCTAVSVTGQFDEISKTFTISHRFEEFCNDKEQKFYQLFHKVFNCPVVIKNNVSFMALGQVEKSNISSDLPILYMFLDYGIASSIIFKNEILSGWHGYAGEIGGTYMGEKGSLSTRAAIVHIKERCIDHIDNSKDVYLELKDKYPVDSFIKNQLMEGAETVGLALSNYCNLIGVKTVILGGQALNINKELNEKIESVLKRRSIAPVEILISENPDIAIFGALSQAKNQALDNILENSEIN